MATSTTNDFLFGQKTGTAGTAVQLDSTEYAVKSVALIAHSSNGGRVFYGGSAVASTTQKGLATSESLTLSKIDGRAFLLSSIYIDVEITGDGVDFIAERG